MFSKGFIEKVYKSYAYKSKRNISHRKEIKASTSKSVGNGENALWTEKYKPRSSFEVIGNVDKISSLKEWLGTWKDSGRKSGTCPSSRECTPVKKKVGRDACDSDSDFQLSATKYCYDDESSRGGDDGLDILKGNILYGPPGCGKTCAIYACAQDLGFKVLEMNASSKRTGKDVLSQFGETAQSHLVQKGLPEAAEKGVYVGGEQKEKMKSKRRVKKRKVSSTFAADGLDYTLKQDVVENSLILMEDIDLVFEDEDRGFWSGVAQLLRSSKRPILFTANCKSFEAHACLL